MEEYYVEVGTADYKENLCLKLRDLKVTEGLPIDIYESEKGTQYFVRCVYSTIKGRREKDRLTARIYNYYFARALAEVVFQGWEELFIRKVLKKEYSMKRNDIEDIVRISWRNLNREDQTYFPETRKHVLVKSILEFLNVHKRFDIEGFMNFRADLYKRELKKQIARAVNDYALEQEHEGFVRLLKRFLDSRHPIYKTMHMIIKAQGEVRFFDDHGRDINKECFEENYSLPAEGEEDSLTCSKKRMELYEDLLISTILKCAPLNLVIHAATERYQDIIGVMQEVFEGKISFCMGCSLCQQAD